MMVHLYIPTGFSIGQYREVFTYYTASLNLNCYSVSTNIYKQRYSLRVITNSYSSNKLVVLEIHSPS